MHVYLSLNEIDNLEKEFIKEFPLRIYTQENESNRLEVTRAENLSSIQAFVGAFGQKPTQYTTLKKKTIKEELGLYSNTIRNNKLGFSEFWSSYSKEFPMLHKKMLKTNIIPATSVASESCFSVAGFIQRKERSRLSSKNLKFNILTKDFEKINSLLNLFQNKAI